MADGMGGTRGGELASAAAIAAVDDCLRSSMGQAESWLRVAFERAHAAVRDLSRSKLELRRAGTTLVAALIRDDELWVANVGDSRAYLIRRYGAEQITVDHSWAEEEIRAGMVGRSSAAAKAHRHILTRSLGSGSQLDVDVFGAIYLTPGDRVLLCSDGLYGAVPDTDLACMTRSFDPDMAAHRLVETANSAGGPDNISVIVIKSEAA